MSALLRLSFTLVLLCAGHVQAQDSMILPAGGKQGGTDVPDTCPTPTADPKPVAIPGTGRQGKNGKGPKGEPELPKRKVGKGNRR